MERIVKVLEVDQWVAIAVKDAGYSLFDFERVYPADLGLRPVGEKPVIKEVSEDDEPKWSHVWFKENEEGELEFYKANYDSSG